MMSENKNPETTKPQENAAPNQNTQPGATENKPESAPSQPAAPASLTTTQNQAPASPAGTSPSTVTAPASNDQKPKTGSNMKLLLVSLLMFLLGIGGGILLYMTYPKSQEKAVPITPAVSPTPAPLTLPADAQKIDECVDGEGEAYVSRSSPDRNMRYLGFKNKLIGFQYKLSGDMLNFNTLKLPKADIDHARVRIAKIIRPLMLRPDAIGSPVPTAELMTMEEAVTADDNNEDIYVNFYLVDSKISSGIVCESRMLQKQISSPSANVMGGPEAIQPLMQTDAQPIEAIDTAAPSAAPTTPPATTQ